MYGVGQILAGKYRVDYQLGEGGMGVVLAATHMHLGTQVALKLLRPEMSHGPIVERFLREARASAQLRSENVCRVSDVGVLENGVPFIVMEMLLGHDLAAMLKASGPMPVANAAEFILQASIGVAEAHAAKIVHRDLKPGNLMWTQRPDGTHLIKVLDFGVAKAPEGVDFSLTQTSNIIGSPGYMSPEQLKSSKDVDARSDIWSLGIMLYELVSGKPPWTGESITEIALHVAMDPMPPLVGMGPFESVIARCLEKSPANRYSTVADLAAALAPFAGPRGADLAGAVARVLRGSQVAIQHNPNATVMAQSTPTTLRGASGVVVNRTQAHSRSWKLPAAIGLGASAGIIAVVLATTGSKVVQPSSGNHVSAPSSDTDTKAPDTKAPDTTAPDTKAPDTKAPDTKAPDTAATGAETAAKAADAAAGTADKPDTAAKKPDTANKPDTATKKPDTGTKKPDTATKKPDSTKKPDTGTKKPDTGTRKPDTGTKKPKPEDVGDSRT